MKRENLLTKSENVFKSSLFDALDLLTTCVDGNVDLTVIPYKFTKVAAIWSENSDFGQNSDQNHGKCSFGQKKIRILDSSQKF